MTQLAQSPLIEALDEPAATRAVAELRHDTTAPRARRVPPFRRRGRQLKLVLLPSPRAVEPAAPAVDPLALAQAVAPEAALRTIPIQDQRHADALLAPGDTIVLKEPGHTEAAQHAGTLMWLSVDGGPQRLRRLFEEDAGRLRLEAQDPAAPVEIVPRASVRILGEVVTIMRAARDAGATSSRP